MNNDRYFLYERDNLVKVYEYDPFSYGALSDHPGDWFIPDMLFDDKESASEAADIINALIDGRSSTRILVRRLLFLT